MAVNADQERQGLHRLIESLNPDQLEAARRYLLFLSADPALLSLLTAEPDDEPYTDEQRQQDLDSEAVISRGEGVSHEEVLREYGL